MSHTSHPDESVSSQPELAPDQDTKTYPTEPQVAPRIIAALSLKGGVGKTSVVLGIAGAATAAGLKVLVVDLDPQANATATLKNCDAEFTTSDVLYDGRPGIAAEAIVSGSWDGKLDLIASEPALEHRSQSPGAGSELRLRTALEGVAEQYDLVLFDCPPSLGELTRNALYAANEALVVTEPTVFAVQGAAQAIEAVQVVAANGNLGLKPAGVVVNRMRTTLADHRAHLAGLETEFGSLVLGGLPDRSAVPQAQGARVPVQEWDSNGAADMSKALGLLLNKLMGTEATGAPTTTKSVALDKTRAQANQQVDSDESQKSREISLTTKTQTVDLTTKKPESTTTAKAKGKIVSQAHDFDDPASLSADIESHHAPKQALANITPTFHFTTSE